MGSGSDDGVGGKVVGMDAAKLEIKDRRDEMSLVYKRKI